MLEHGLTVNWDPVWFSEPASQPEKEWGLGVVTIPFQPLPSSLRNQATGSPGHSTCYPLLVNKLGRSPQTLSSCRAKGSRWYPWWFLTLEKVGAVASLAVCPGLYVCFSCTISCFHTGDKQVPGSQISSKVTCLCLQSFHEEAEPPPGYSQQEQGLWLSRHSPPACSACWLEVYQ